MSSFEEPTDPAGTTTGIASIDVQHQELHCLIKQLDLFPHESILSLRTQRLLKDVWRCSFDHFEDEERLMAELGVAPMQLGSHVADHARCLNYVANLWSAQHRCLSEAPFSGEVYCELAEYWRRHVARYDLTIPWR